MSTTNNTLLFLLPLIAYFVGSIPTAVWVGKIFFKTDIRQHGSGNAGATNTIRVLGWKPGIAVLIFDILKGWLTVSIINFVYLPGLTADQGVYYQILLGLLVVLGHIFPVFAGFRGGKGVATLLGVGIALYPVSVWIVLAVFIFVLTASGYVSLGSVIGGISLPSAAYRADCAGYRYRNNAAGYPSEKYQKIDTRTGEKDNMEEMKACHNSKSESGAAQMVDVEVVRRAAFTF